jgi:hypothetical protein
VVVVEEFTKDDESTFGDYPKNRARKQAEL